MRPRYFRDNSAMQTDRINCAPRIVPSAMFDFFLRCCVVLIGSLCVVAMASSAAALPQSVAALPGVQPLPDARRADVYERLKDTPGGYVLEQESEGWLLHDGDLTVSGSLDLDASLVVAGDLRIDGSLDDRHGQGHLVVLGDLAVDNVFSWGMLYVAGDLDARGVVFAVYNDYTFDVDGRVNGTGLVISDKSADYTAGALGFELNDNDYGDDYDARAGRALQLLQPALFTDPDDLELDEYSTLGTLDPEFDRARAWAREGRSLLRAEPAPPQLAAQAAAAIAADTPVETLRALIAGDVLLPQLIAARPDVPAALHADLLAVDDPVVQRWMARVAPAAAYARRKRTLTPDVAAPLAIHPDTGDDVLEAIAAHADPAVRVTLAERDPLPLALREALADDADASVRVAFVNDQISAALRAKRVQDADPAVRRAVAALSLDAAQTRALLAIDDDELRGVLARSLRAQAEFRAPRRMADADRHAIAAELLAAAPQMDDEFSRTQCATDAFLALAADEQAERFASLLQQVDADVVAEYTPSAALMERIVAMAQERDAPIPEQLGSNVRLPDALQAAIVDAAAAWDPDDADPDSYEPTPDDALEALLYNDAARDIVSAARFMQITRLVLDRGIAPADGGMQNAYFHYHGFDADAIAAIGEELGTDEDWALTVLLQPAATRAQLVPALSRWYDDEDVQAELQRIAALDDAAFWPALARAEAADLREAAARNRHAPVELLAGLLEDSDEDVRLAACWNTRLPAEHATRLARAFDACVFGNPAVPLDVLQQVALDAPTAELRGQAWEALSLRRRLQ